MREIVHLQAGQCGNQIGAKVRKPAGQCKAWIWNLEQWTLCAPGPSDKSSDLITSSLVKTQATISKYDPETVGPCNTKII
uniref:Uncharacterized protein n=1 Tax=Gouania willdenowi TaxID=441366 RepID=A0A8C5D5I5_GOUWI